MDGDRVIRHGVAVNRISSEEGPGTATSSVTPLECANTEWTDKKHSLYLNSMEESFVNQLYNHNYYSKRRKGRDSSGSKFKVQRRGYWDEIKFERTPTETDVVNDSWTASDNPWTRRLKSSNTGYAPTSSAKQISSSCSSSFYHRYFVGSSTEVSDQNFMDNDGQVENKVNVSEETEKCSF